jgi:hypothetical protein
MCSIKVQVAVAGAIRSLKELRSGRVVDVGSTWASGIAHKLDAWCQGIARYTHWVQDAGMHHIQPHHSG